MKHHGHENNVLENNEAPNMRDEELKSASQTDNKMNVLVRRFPEENLKIRKMLFGCFAIFPFYFFMYAIFSPSFEMKHFPFSVKSLFHGEDEI